MSTPQEQAAAANARYIQAAGGTAAPSTPSVGTSPDVPTALTNPNLFGGQSVDPGAAQQVPTSPWSTQGVPTGEVQIQESLTYPSGGWAADPYEVQALEEQQHYELQLNDDLTAVQESRFEDVQNYKQLAELAIRGVNSEDDAMAELSQALMHELRDIDAFRGVFSIIDQDKTFEDYYNPPEEPGRVRRGMAWVGNLLDQSSQFGLGLFTDLSGLQDPVDVGSAVRRTGEAGVRLADFLTDAATTVTGVKSVQKLAEMAGIGEYTKFVMPDYWSEEIKDQALDAIEDPNDLMRFDRNDDGRVDFIEAAGISQGWGEDIGWKGLNLNNAVNLAGEMALDPASYITFGAGGMTGRAAKSGMEVLDDIALRYGNDMLQRGVLAADDFDRVVRLHANIKSGKRWSSFAGPGDRDFLKKILEQNYVDQMGRQISTAADIGNRASRGIERQAQQVARRSGGGVYFAGMPIPGTRAASQVMKSAGLIGTQWSPVERTVYNTVVERAKQFGDDVAELTELEAADVMQVSRKRLMEDLAPLFEKTGQTMDDAVLDDLLRDAGGEVESKLYEYFDKAHAEAIRRKTESEKLSGNIIRSMNSSSLQGIKRDSQGVVLNNPLVSKLRHTVDNIWTPFARVANISGDERNAAVRRIAGDITTRHETIRQEATDVMLSARSRAVDEAKRSLGLKSGASDRLNREFHEIRSLTGDERIEAIDRLRSAGRTELVNYIDLYDATMLKLRDLNKEIGYATDEWDPLRYAPRGMSKEAVDTFNKLKDEGGLVWESLQQASTKDSDGILQEMVGRGIITADEAKRSGGIGSLLGPFMKRTSKDITGEIPEEMNLHTLLVGSKFGKTRTFLPDAKNIVDLNKQISDIFSEFGVKITDFYDIDPVDGFIRYMDSWSDDMVLHDFLGDMQRLTLGDIQTGAARPAVVQGSRDIRPAYDEFGDAIADQNEVIYSWTDPQSGVEQIVRGKTSEEVIEKVKEAFVASPYQVRPVGGGKFYLVDMDLMEEIDRTLIPRIKKGSVESTIMRNIDAWNSIWAAHATVPLVGAAFHARNSIGNWFNMALAGFKNPMLLTEAAHLQSVNKAVHKRMSKSVYTSWEQAAADMIKDGATETVGRKTVKIVQKDIDKLTMLRQNGAISGSFFNDLKTDRILFSGADQKSTLQARLVDNPLINTGQALGSTIENNARIALFLDGVEQGMTPAAASARVKKFLFDYSDLTPFEDKNIRTFSRFYTWMRKNTELQARMMLSAPGSVMNTQKTLDAIMAGLFGDDGDPRQRGFLIPEFADGANMMFNAQDTYLHGYETPFTSAVDVLGTSFSTLALIPGLENLVPEPLRAKDVRSNFSSTLGLLASGPTTGLNYIYEQATGVDTFTGAQISDSRYAQAVSFIEALFPSVSKTAREFERLQGFEKLGIEEDGWGLVSEHQEGQAGLRMMNLMLGMNVYSLNEEQQARALSAITGMYEEKRRDLRNEGIDAPTMEELKEAGAVGETDMLLSALFFAADPVKSIEAKLPTGFKELIAQELGIPLDMTEATEKPIDQLADEAEAFYELIEYRLDRKLTPTERWQLGFQLPGMPSNPELEALGLNPYRENQFLQEEDAEANIARANEWLAAMAPVWGMSVEEIKAANPLLSEAQIYMSDALAIGKTPESAMREYIAELSRTRRAQLFGVDTLEEFDYEKSMTDEERLSLNRRIWEDAMQYMVIAQYFGMPMDAQSAINYVNYGADRLLQGERELLGIDKRQSIPNREDPRPDEEIAQEAGLTWDQINQVTTGVVDSGGLPLDSSPPRSLWSS